MTHHAVPPDTAGAGRDDSQLAELAATAVAAIESRIGRGEDMYTVVTEVVSQILTTGNTDPLRADPQVVDRVRDAILAMLDGPGRG